jgi:DNA-binding CsgD family transcriptional regulator
MQPRCPVLIGRGDLLALADRRIAAARDADGHLLLLTGEAGIGKTRLLEAVRDRAAAAGFTVHGAAAYPGDAEVAGGALLELFPELPPAGLDAGRYDGDPHRRRRLRTSALAGQILDLAAAGPALLALEDLHWADELTLDALERAAAGLPGRPMLVVVTYRSDELHPRAPARAWRARLLTRRLAEEARLPRLDPAETAEMAARIAGAPVPQTVAAAVYERSDGIPLHVEEFLDRCLPRRPAAPPPGADVAPPDTLADAVLARAAGLGPAARALADAACVIGRSFDLDLLAAIAEGSDGGLDAALRELEERHFVQPGGLMRYDFRHSLIREALYCDLSPMRRRALHLRAARAGVAGGLRAAFVSDQFELARRPVQAHRYALAAAREAAQLSAHREAAELYRRARRTTPPLTAAGPRAALLAELGAELAAVDDNEGAAEALGEAYELLCGLGEPVRAAALAPMLADARHALGADIDERDRLLRDALALLDHSTETAGTPDGNASTETAGTPDGNAATETAGASKGNAATEPARARILAALSAAYLLDRCLDDTIDLGRRAKAIDADPATQVNVDATLGAALVFGGQMDEGWDLMSAALEGAERACLEAEVSRGHRMIGCCASALVEYERGLRVLRDGYAYAGRIERFNDRNYMAAHVGHVLWATGDWPAARRWAGQALADGHGDLGTRATALHVLGFLAMGAGAGARDAAARTLREARELGERVGELQRLSPALWGLAELALHDGRPAEAAAWCGRGYELSEPSGDAAYLFPFVVTGVRAHLATGDPAAAREFFGRCEHWLRYRRIPGTMPALDHAEGLLHLAAGRAGRARTALAAASAGWDARRRFWEGVHALRDQARAAHRSRRPAEAAALSAEAARRARAAGATLLLDGAPPPGGEPPPPPLLTARETEVARLVATGATNRQIAAALYISPKTVAAHVEHILTKLGAARRAEIAAWAASA